MAVWGWLALCALSFVTGAVAMAQVRVMTTHRRELCGPRVPAMPKAFADMPMKEE
jgi:hypothetical protein